MLASLPAKGAGLAFREPFRADLFRHRSEVGFLEVTAEHYLGAPPEKEAELALLAAHFPLVPHGLDLSLGSAEGLDTRHLERLARLVRRLDPPWWSEHIAFTRAGGVRIGHLAPLPFTREAIAVLCRNIDHVRRRIETPLILENITYTLALPGAEMSEAEFLTEIVARTGCGLLLDVTNLYTNSVNHGYDPVAFLERLPLEQVVQLHVAGGHWQDGTLIDSHSRSTPPEVWRLVETIVDRAPVKGIALERDEELPALGALLPEIAQAHAIGRRCGRWA